MGVSTVIHKLCNETKRHALPMSFVGAVGTLMSNTGLTELMQTNFGGDPKMLSGKKFPQNVRALRMVVGKNLRSIVTGTDTYDQLVAILDDKASQSRTAKLWVDNLIKPVLLMMVFVRAEREADWPLHLWAVAQMLPCFFASSHCNYASMSSLACVMVIYNTIMIMI